MGHQVRIFHVHHRSPVVADAGIGDYEVDVLDVMLRSDLVDCVSDDEWNIETERNGDQL